MWLLKLCDFVFTPAQINESLISKKKKCHVDWRPYLQYSDIPCEALHCLVQLPALQPFFGSQVMKVLMKFHG